MATSAPDTPTSGESIYFDAPHNMATQPLTNGDGATGEEQDAPKYTPPGPDDKPSRSYLPVDSKPKFSHEAADTSNAGIGRQSVESSHPVADMTSQSDIVRSPTSISGGSGVGHKKNEGSTFANGAAVTGPNSHPEVDESVHDRAATADLALPSKTKTKLSKAERELCLFILAAILMILANRQRRQASFQNHKI